MQLSVGCGDGPFELQSLRQLIFDALQLAPPVRSFSLRAAEMIAAVGLAIDSGEYNWKYVEDDDGVITTLMPRWLLFQSDAGTCSVPDAEIAPTFGSRAQIDRPLAVVDAVSTPPVIYWVHATSCRGRSGITDVVVSASATVLDA